MTSRYDGKPLLRLLECYVLNAIGELARADQRTLEQMTPKLQVVYKLDGDWQSILSQVMHFPDTIDDNVRSAWARNCKLAAQHGEEPMPEDFARKVVDETLATS
jgi:hypothetical protein